MKWRAQTERWMPTAMRPDVYPAPVQRAAAVGESAREGLPSDGGGKAMPAAVQAKMEGSFGTDFSAVRIHEGPRSEALGARAYTQGTDVHFAPGEYQPESQGGQELLGHELTHVVQQSQGRVKATTQAKGVGVNDDAELEAQADAMGARAARGEPVADSGAPAVRAGEPHAAGVQLFAKPDVHAPNSGAIAQLKKSDPTQAKAKAMTYAALIRGHTGLFELADAIETTDYSDPTSVDALLKKLQAEPWKGREAGLTAALAEFQKLLMRFQECCEFDPEYERAFINRVCELPIVEGERDVTEDGLTPIEKQKRAKVLARYKASFGDKLGQLYYDAVHDAISQESIASYAKQGSEALFDLTSKWLAEQGKDDEQPTDKVTAAYKAKIAEQAKEFMASPAGKSMLQKLGIRGFLDAVESDPETLTRAVLAAGYIAYAKNVDLPTSTKLKLGDGQSLKLEHDVGQVQKIALQKVGLTYSKSVPSKKKGAKKGEKVETVKLGASYDKGGPDDNEKPNDKEKPEATEVEAKLASANGLNSISGNLRFEDGDISTYKVNVNLADEFTRITGGVQRSEGATTATLFTQIGSKTHYGSAGVTYNLEAGQFKLDTKQKFGNLMLHQQYINDRHLDAEKPDKEQYYDAHQVFNELKFNFGPGNKAGGPKNGMKYSIAANARYEIQDEELIGFGSKFAMSKKDFTDFLVNYRFTYAADVSQHAFETQLKQTLGKWSTYMAGNVSVKDGKLSQGGGEAGALYKLNDDIKFGGLFGVKGYRDQATQIEVGAAFYWKKVPVTFTWRPMADKLAPNDLNPGIVSIGFRKLF